MSRAAKNRTKIIGGVATLEPLGRSWVAHRKGGAAFRLPEGYLGASFDASNISAMRPLTTHSNSPLLEDLTLTPSEGL